MPPKQHDALPTDLQPVTRLTHVGAGALSNSELLALTISDAGYRNADALRLAQELITETDGLLNLGRLTLDELANHPGIGQTTAAKIKAAFELGMRLTKTALYPTEPTIINSPADVAHLLMVEMSLLEQEHLRVVLLNTKNVVLRIINVYVGNLGAVTMRVGEVFREAIRSNCASIIVVHNHPSGDPTPSPEDVRVTGDLVTAGKLLDIEVLDHLVIGHNRYVSLKERGLGFQ